MKNKINKASLLGLFSLVIGVSVCGSVGASRLRDDLLPERSSSVLTQSVSSETILDFSPIHGALERLNDIDCKIGCCGRLPKRDMLFGRIINYTELVLSSFQECLHPDLIKRCKGRPEFRSIPSYIALHMLCNSCSEYKLASEISSKKISRDKLRIINAILDNFRLQTLFNGEEISEINGDFFVEKIDKCFGGETPEQTNQRLQSIIDRFNNIY